MRWIFIFLLPLAFSLLVGYYPIKNRVPVGEYAIYKIIVENNENISLNYKIYGLGLQEKSFSLNPGEKTEITAYVECRAAIPYNSPLYIEYDGKKQVLFLRIFGYEKKKTAFPSCFISSEQTGVDEALISISCNLDIKKTELFIDGIKIEGKDVFYVGGLRPGMYSAFLKIYFENTTIEREIPIEIKEVINVHKKILKSYGLFFNEYSIIIENKGNEVYYGGILLDELGFLIAGAKKQRDKVVLYFLVKPGEKKVYRILFLNKAVLLYIIPIVALLAVLIVWRPISVKKEYIYYSKDGRTKVHVFIKVKGFPLGADDVRIIDYIPNYAKVENFETIQPEIKENMLIWKIPRIKRGEEIYLNYNLVFDFEVAEGVLKLPDCYVMIGEKKYKVSSRIAK